MMVLALCLYQRIVAFECLLMILMHRISTLLASDEGSLRKSCFVVFNGLIDLSFISQFFCVRLFLQCLCLESLFHKSYSSVSDFLFATFFCCALMKSQIPVIKRRS